MVRCSNSYNPDSPSVAVAAARVLNSSGILTEIVYSTKSLSFNSLELGGGDWFLTALAGEEHCGANGCHQCET